MAAEAVRLLTGLSVTALLMLLAAVLPSTALAARYGTSTYAQCDYSTGGTDCRGIEEPDGSLSGTGSHMMGYALIGASMAVAGATATVLFRHRNRRLSNLTNEGNSSLIERR